MKEKLPNEKKNIWKVFKEKKKKKNFKVNKIIFMYLFWKFNNFIEFFYFNNNTKYLIVFRYTLLTNIHTAFQLEMA